jgi:hypothetical protein
MQKELKKLLDAKIIFQVRHSAWVTNMVCVDFRNLNRDFAKDNYLLPSMEQLLQTISGVEIFSPLDGFSGYNQVLVS